MTLKKILKYIAFIFLFMFLFVPNVNASTRYLTCEYRNDQSKENGVDIKAQRFIYKSGKYLIGAAQSKNWNAGIGTYYDANHNLLASPNFSRATCADYSFYDYVAREQNMNVSKTIAYPLTTNKEYNIEDITCWYEISKNNILKLNIPSDFYGGNQVSTNNQKIIYEYLPIKETSTDAINYQSINKSWYYLKNRNGIGCPLGIADNGTYIYLAYKNISKNDIDAADKPLNNSFKGGKSSYNAYNLICNEDTKNEVDQGYTDLEKKYKNAFEEYANTSKESWENSRKQCENSNSCETNTQNMNNYAKEMLEYMLESAIKEMETYATKNEKLLIDSGCEKSSINWELAQAEMGKAYKNAVETLIKNGVIDKQTGNKIIEEGNETLEEKFVSIEGLLKEIFSIHDNELSKLADNKKKIVDCNAIFGDPCEKDSLSLMCFITVIFNIIRYLIPGILILLGSIDFAKVVLSNEKEAMSKSVSTFFQRIIIAIAIFFLPLLVNFVLKIFDSGYSMSDKINCVIESLAGD